MLCGFELPIANHPLFAKKWGKYAKLYNQLVEDFNLNDNQIIQLRQLLEHSKGVERLGYLTAYKIGLESTSLEREFCELSEGMLSLDKKQ